MEAALATIRGLLLLLGVTGGIKRIKTAEVEKDDFIPRVRADCVLATSSSSTSRRRLPRRRAAATGRADLGVALAIAPR
jgi:hypothetical protein